MTTTLEELKALYGQVESQEEQCARLEQSCLQYFTEERVKGVASNRDNPGLEIANGWGNTLDEDHFSSLSDKIKTSLQEIFPGVLVEITKLQKLFCVKLSGWAE